MRESATPHGTGHQQRGASRGGLVRAAKSMMGRDQVRHHHAANAGGGDMDWSDKSATWPRQEVQVHSYSSEEPFHGARPAGRPTTPEAERVRRKHRENERQQRSGAMAISIPFHDVPAGGTAPAPPQSFLDAIEAHDHRQKQRRHHRGDERPTPARTIGSSPSRRPVEGTGGTSTRRAPGAGEAGEPRGETQGKALSGVRSVPTLTAPGAQMAAANRRGGAAASTTHLSAPKDQTGRRARTPAGASRGVAGTHG